MQERVLSPNGGEGKKREKTRKTSPNAEPGGDAPPV